MLTDENLVLERPHFCFPGVQRIYALPNGMGLSFVNPPELHNYPFAWEAAVLSATEGSWILVYSTPLTSDVEVFFTDDEANAFIARAIAWAKDATSD